MVLFVVVMVETVAVIMVFVVMVGVMVVVVTEVKFHDCQQALKTRVNIIFAWVGMLLETWYRH